MSVWWENGWDGVEWGCDGVGGLNADSKEQGDCAAGMSQAARKGRRRRARKLYRGAVRGGAVFTSGRAEAGMRVGGEGYWLRLDTVFWLRVRVWSWRLQVLWRRAMYRAV